VDGSLKAQAHLALRELGGVFERLSENSAEPLIEALRTARCVALHGLGREGLMMRAFTMRLFHLGLNVHVVGDMTTPPVGPGDLLVVSSGPGALATHDALIGIAQAAGARVAVITAQPEGATSRRADLLVVLPAQTMADDRPAGGAAASVLPMGSLFEFAQLLFFELVVLELRGRIGQTAEGMRARHTNLE
jgi:6-phospho-3-hexuloisomerase